jgi:hypothetical protein
MRVLKPTGSAFIDLGDKYSTGMYSHDSIRTVSQPNGEWSKLGQRGEFQRQVAANPGVPPKSLLLLPERYRIGCVDRLGLIARAVICWCLSGGARVYARTPTGDRPIMLRDLARAYQPEQVQLWNGHKWTQVLGWSRTPDDEDALELEFRSGERVGSTPNHQWPTTDGLKRTDELRIGDVVLQTALPEPDQPHYPAGLNADDIGWLVGLYIAEGSRSEATIQIAGHINETTRHARLDKIAEAYDGTCRVYQTSENGSTCNLTGPVLLGIIDQYVSPGTAKTKRLRKAAWQRSNQFLAAVVEGYLDGDGHYDEKNDRYRLGFTANDEWAADLRTLAARLGHRLRLRRRTTSFNGRVFPGWGGEWRWRRPVRCKPDTEIVAIRRSRARDFYDLGVADEPHLFALASGVLTHNSKPNGLPESVTDRVRRSHEDWVHLVRQPRYYSATDEVREPTRDDRAPGLTYAERQAGMGRVYGEYQDAGHGHTSGGNGMAAHPLGKLPGSVWTIPSEPLRLPDHLGVQHYAAFPGEWPRRLILGWSPPGICCECGTGRVPVVERSYEGMTGPVNPTSKRFDPGQGNSFAHRQAEWAVGRTTILGYACSCTPFTDHPGPWREYHLDRWTPPPTRPAVVLDPFSGVGTTPMVARALGRIGVGVDLKADYCRAARWRVRYDGAKAVSRTWAERQGSLL